MTSTKMESIIKEVEHSLAVEGMTMTEEEKENLRRVGRGELTYSELIERYIAAATHNNIVDTSQKDTCDTRH